MKITWHKISSGYWLGSSENYPVLMRTKKGWKCTVHRKTGRFYLGIEGIHAVHRGYHKTALGAKRAAQKWCDSNAIPQPNGGAV